MKNQQLLVDSKLAQLRTEHNELYATWSDISFMATDGGDGVVVGGADIARPTTADTNVSNNGTLFAWSLCCNVCFACSAAYDFVNDHIQ